MRTTEQLTRIFGQEAATRVSTARLLVVGAGGIGCELLKDLSMSGFQHIEAVDLDTIDLSNLNRQFLFQRRHIKRPKSEVAIQAIRDFNPGIDAHARQANIKEPTFDVDWFSQFDLVLNALDNLEARRHVNTMCLAAHVPLIESGTAGYLGQVTVIKGGETECFECHPKPVERKTFPICTIRSTPSAPIHCIVWAKNYLFAQLFGERQDDEDMTAEEDAENMEELKQLREESMALAKLAEAMGSLEFARVVFEKVFSSDIARLLSMADMWKHRQPPTQLDYDELESAALDSDFDPMSPGTHSAMSLTDAFALFKYTAARLAQRLDSDEQGTRGSISFDKDDEDALNFVAATASLRSYVFGIDQTSIFETKAMAGNIIPAIATTNAVVAGMMVTQAIMVVSEQMSRCHTAYVSYNSKRSRSVLSEPLALPNPVCAVCRRRYLTLRVADLSRTTLGDVVDYLHMLAETENNLYLGEDISVVEGSRILYDLDFEDNMEKSMEELGLWRGRMITVAREDLDDVESVAGTVPVVLSIAGPRVEDASQPLDLDIEGFELIPEFAPLPPPTPDEAVPNGDQLHFADDDVAVVVDDSDGDEGLATLHHVKVDNISDELAKRKLSDIGVRGESSIKRRAVATDDEATISE
ncbi:E1 ubiquitin-activating protein uba2 [Coemansia pectinata]|uniref:E1 ubiquitin-activating protein uba2 n=1 Tax=Coemansia pectinata TaxID=1052879 RepID=A0A9W8GWU4_9FUNG|nr:E1 ubiquitin-activating protein uba2 [Coemansia pectinata]